MYMKQIQKIENFKMVRVIIRDATATLKTIQKSHSQVYCIVLYCNLFMAENNVQIKAKLIQRANLNRPTSK